jgi:mRNA-degrading endonuclease toxin of MazEF toxin-antitoxin module
MKRGDVILVRFPHPSCLRGKKRPAVIVQSDAYAGTVKTPVVAEVTQNQGFPIITWSRGKL